MQAANANELAQLLGESGLELIEAKQQNAKTETLRRERRGRGPLAQLIALCGQLEDLLRAGLPFPAALQTVAQALPSGPLREQITAIQRSIQHGISLSASFGQHPQSFGPVFRAILAAGEGSGDLAATFAQLAQQLRWQSALQEQIRRAVRYPLFLVGVAVAVMAFMMTMVVPQIVTLLESLSADLPLFTRLLIGVSRLFAAGWWMALLAFAMAALLVALARRASNDVARRTDGWILRTPGLGPVLRKLSVARFARSLTALLQSGVDLPSSLALASGVLGNRHLIAIVEAAQAQVQSGQALSAATAALFPPFVLPMIRVGEQSGQLAKTLHEVSRACDSEAQAAVSRFLGTLEPALTLLVGALLAWVVLAVLGPVYGSLGRLSGG